jgi:hypothetical protein
LSGAVILNGTNLEVRFALKHLFGIAEVLDGAERIPVKRPEPTLVETLLANIVGLTFAK